jgi:hypothetical protein
MNKEPEIVHVPTDGISTLTVQPDPHPDSAVIITTDPHGTGLTPWQMFDFIETMLKVGKIPYDTTGAMGLIISRPVSPNVVNRCEELSMRFFDVELDALGITGKHVIEFIIEGELARGELR